MSTSISEINRIVRTDPLQLKFLFKSCSEDKRRLTRLISHLVPYRVGLEFETFGTIGSHYYTIDELKSYGSKSINKMICHKLNITDFREDTHIESPVSDEEYSDRDMNEVRVSFSGYKQLIPFWRTVQVLKTYLEIPKVNGGIHIHIDAPFVRSKEGRNYAITWFNQDCILNEVLQVFEGYNGTYNKRKSSGHKGSWIRVSEYPTVEFRIARLTYNYKTIIRWIISCSDLVRRCKTDFLNHKFIDKSNSDSKDGDLLINIELDEVNGPDEEIQMNPNNGVIYRVLSDNNISSSYYSNYYTNQTCTCTSL